METNKFIELCKKEVVKFMDDLGGMSIDDVFVVWYSKTLQNNKALLATTLNDLYFEFTYNGDKKELYLDSYVKWSNLCIDVEDN